VDLVPYRLGLDDGWRLEAADLATAPFASRAVVVVHPNNPTGSYVHDDDATALVELCRERGWAVIADEVFADYPLADDAGTHISFATERRCLTFTLGGLSKSCGLPQLKLGWIVVTGPERDVATALGRLEFLADTYLSVSTPVQAGLPRLLAAGAGIRVEISSRCRGNLAHLQRLTARCPHLELLRPSAGWSAVLRYPAVVDEEDLAIELLEDDGVAVYPGYLFDFPRPGFLVVSLLPDPLTFAAGSAALAARIAGHLSV
jgi:alanine-synthesizing transaminase